MRHIFFAVAVAALAAMALHAREQTPALSTTVVPLNSTPAWEFVNTNADFVTYRGRKALHLSPPPNQPTKQDSMVALVPKIDFKDGTIELDVAGLPIPEMDPTARGFVGVEFRASEHGSRAENIYIRPTNGRADDQLRRNHSVQYESFPDFPWNRLRQESPGVYESYVDLEVGAWTSMKIQVSGTKARLYVNGAAQPCLIVNDLKLGDARGQIGLWAFIATQAYFANLRITRAT